MITACSLSGKSSTTSSRRNEGQLGPGRRLRPVTVTGPVTNMRADHAVERPLHPLISTTLICVLATSSLAGAEYDGTTCKCSSCTVIMSGAAAFNLQWGYRQGREIVIVLGIIDCSVYTSPAALAHSCFLCNGRTHHTCQCTCTSSIYSANCDECGALY